jgi:hypothetical protein
MKQSSLALSPRANCTDWATATYRRNLVPIFVDRGMSRGQRGGPTTAIYIISKINYIQNNLLNNIQKLINEQRYFSDAELSDQPAYQLLMWFWSGIEIIQLVSCMSAPSFGDESSWVRWLELVQGSSGACISFR